MASSSNNQVDNVLDDSDDDIQILEVLPSTSTRPSDDAHEAAEAKRDRLLLWIREQRDIEDRLKRELQRKGELIDALNAGSEQLKVTVEELRKEISSLEERLRKEQSERQKLETESAAERRTSLDFVADIERDLRNKIAEKDAQISHLNGHELKRRKELEASCNDLEAEVKRLKGVAKEANSKVDELDAKLSAARKETIELQEERLQLKQKISLKDTEINELTVAKGRLERELLESKGGHDHKVDALKEELEKSKDELEKAQKRLQKEQEKNNTKILLKEMEGLKEQLRKKKDELHKAQKDLKAQPTNKFAGKEDWLNKLVKQKDDDLAKVVADKSNMEAELRGQIASLHRELATFKQLQHAVPVSQAPTIPTVRLVPPTQPFVPPPPVEMRHPAPPPQAPAPLTAQMCTPPPPPPVHMPPPPAAQLHHPSPPPGPAPQSPAAQTCGPPLTSVQTITNDPRRKRRILDPTPAAENYNANGARPTKPAEAAVIKPTGAAAIKDLRPGFKKFRPPSPPADTENEPPSTAMPEPAKDTRCESPASLTSSEGSANEESAKLMIRNIYPKVTDDMLRKILVPFGELKSVEIAMKGKESRGYGYAEFVNMEDAKAAMRQLDGYSVLERKLIITWAHEQ